MKNLKVNTQRTWETIIFTASADGYDNERVELIINHDEANYVISSYGQDGLIQFSGRSKGQAKLKLKAIKAAVNWINSDNY